MAFLCTTLGSCAVDISSLVEGEITLRVPSVGASGELINHGFIPGGQRGSGGGRRWCQVENDTVFRASLNGGAIKSSVFGKNHPAFRLTTISAITKAVECVQGPARAGMFEPEDGAIKAGAADGSRSVEISRSIDGQAGGRMCPVPLAGEEMEHGVGLRLRRRHCAGCERKHNRQCQDGRSRWRRRVRGTSRIPKRNGVH